MVLILHLRVDLSVYGILESLNPEKGITRIKTTASFQRLLHYYVAIGWKRKKVDSNVATTVNYSADDSSTSWSIGNSATCIPCSKVNTVNVW